MKESNNMMRIKFLDSVHPKIKINAFHISFHFEISAWSKHSKAILNDNKHLFQKKNQFKSFKIEQSQFRKFHFILHNFEFSISYYSHKNNNDIDVIWCWIVSNVNYLNIWKKWNKMRWNDFIYKNKRRRIKKWFFCWFIQSKKTFKFDLVSVLNRYSIPCKEKKNNHNNILNWTK